MCMVTCKRECYSGIRAGFIFGVNNLCFNPALPIIWCKRSCKGHMSCFIIIYKGIAQALLTQVHKNHFSTE